MKGYYCSILSGSLSPIIIIIINDTSRLYLDIIYLLFTTLYFLCPDTTHDNHYNGKFNRRFDEN